MTMVVGGLLAATTWVVPLLAAGAGAGAACTVTFWYWLLCRLPAAWAW